MCHTVEFKKSKPFVSGCGGFAICSFLEFDDNNALASVEFSFLRKQDGDAMPDQQWEILSEQQVLEHPYVNVTYQSVRVSDDLTIPDWPIVRTRDYVNVMVANEDGQLMVLEGYKHGLGRSSWQVVGGYLEPGEEAMAAAQRELLEETGYHSDSWLQLGNFVVDANRFVGQGHFFLARHARSVADPDHDDLEAFAIHWVSPAVLQAALFDGRVGVMGYAVNIALGLLALNQAPD